MVASHLFQDRNHHQTIGKAKGDTWINPNRCEYFVLQLIKYKQFMKWFIDHTKTLKRLILSIYGVHIFDLLQWIIHFLSLQLPVYKRINDIHAYKWLSFAYIMCL